MYKIYCDLDGCLVNFSKGYYDLTGIDLNGEHKEGSEFWKPIEEAGEDFWFNLEWMDDGKELFNYIKRHKPEILSAPSRHISSRIGKYRWGKINIPGTKINLCYSKYKWSYSDNNSLLIDDRKDIIDSWIEKGGFGILHINTKETIKQLKEIGI